MANRVIAYFEQHYDELIRIAVKITKRYEDAEDVMQTVAYILCKKKDDLDGVENCGAYIAVCIRRASLNFLRKRSYEYVSDPITIDRHKELSMLDEEIKHSPAYDYAEWVMSLEAHLKGYSKEMREAFIAHYIDGVPVIQLAESMGITAKALVLRFIRMRRTLKSNGKSMFNQFNVLIML
jgi:RNA polymerase sigma factor (sigma-70 family)